MQGLVALWAMLSHYSMILFIVALVVSFWAPSVARRGDLKRAGYIGLVGLIVDGLLAVLYIAGSVVTLIAGRMDPVNLLLAALWCWLTYRTYQFLKQIGFIK